MLSISFGSSYSNYKGNDSPEFDGVSSPVSKSGNISANPKYKDTSTSEAIDWDLSLKSSSSLKDAGDPSISDKDGSTSDIGAMGGPNGSKW